MKTTNPNRQLPAVVTVRLVNSEGVAYGPDIAGDLYADVAEAISCEMIEDHRTSGEINVGGQRYRYRSDK
jgi:hypothetical protein